MTITTLNISLRDARKGYWALADNSEIFANLEQVASDSYELPVWEEEDEEETETHEQLVEDIKAQLEAVGVTEYEFSNEIVEY